MDNTEITQANSLPAEIAKATGFSWRPGIQAVCESNKKRAIFRAKKLFAGLVHDMTTLEGNPFTFPEVQTLLDGVTVGGRKLSDQEQVLHTADAWRRLFDLIESDRFDLNKKIFCDLHSFVARGEALAIGEFRSGAVGIAGTDYKPPQAADLDALFDRGLAAIKALDDVHERAFAFFLFGALSQFFWDGNKHTSRLMMAGELLRCGLDISNIPAKKHLEFNQKMVRFYNSKDATEMMGFLRDCILD
jgi:Fic family protein